MNKSDFYNTLEKSPVIAAVKNDECLEKALKSKCNIIFLLYGNIFNLKKIVESVKRSGKIIFIHLDLVEGFSRDNIALQYINEEIHPDGIISTRSQQIRTAKELGLLTIQRLFIIDSLSIENTIKSASSVSPDAVEIMPGIMPRIISSLSEKIKIPLIAGGLVSSKDDVVSALASNARGVSATSPEVWSV
ncbi:MAG: glycerol-3-phosphate responsive antiterminator [Clostridiales bacterium]|nr:glycerol-3-phosphate responsive antiterminator [Clostridiales bacterium]